MDLTKLLLSNTLLNPEKISNPLHQTCSGSAFSLFFFLPFLERGRREEKDEEAQIGISSNSWWATVGGDCHGGQASRWAPLLYYSYSPSKQVLKNPIFSIEKTHQLLPSQMRSLNPNKITQNQPALTTLNDLNIITASIFCFFLGGV